jgi:hypothetical protein
MATRKQRGYDSQRIVANYFKEHGWPYAEPTGAGRQGTDVTGIVGVDVEVKARRALDLTGTLRQQAARASEGVLPLAVIRPDGYGPSKIGEWPVVIPLSVMVELMREAGYQY